MNIPDEAVEAAQATLLSYTGGCVCHEGYTRRNLIDPDCVYHDVPPEVATLILQAAAPYMFAQALDDAVDAFPLETIVAPDNAVVWMMRRAEELRSKI